MKHVMFLTRPGFEKVLREEIERFSPAIRLGYGREGFQSVALEDSSSLAEWMKRPWVRDAIVDPVRSQQMPDASLGDLAVHPAFETRAYARALGQKPWSYGCPEWQELWKRGELGSCRARKIAYGVTPEEWWVGERVRKESLPWYHDPRPSRAAYKLREILELARIRSLKDLRVLDVGAAPGGATEEALSRGAEVVAIDRAELALRPHPKLQHRAMKFQEWRGLYEASDFPIGREWDLFLWDIHADVETSLKLLVPYLRDCFESSKKLSRQAVLTLKLNQMTWAHHIDEYVGRLQDLRPNVLIARQLYWNHQEFSVYLSWER
jgi:hypothetical protein